MKNIPWEQSTAFDILYAIRQHILEEPARLNMMQWRIKRQDSDPINLSEMMGKAYHYLPEHNFPACNTVGCISGWGQILTNMDNQTLYSRSEVLKVPKSVTQILFYLDNWPHFIAKRYNEATTLQSRARITSDLIYWVIDVFEQDIRNYQEVIQAKIERHGKIKNVTQDQAT